MEEKHFGPTIPTSFAKAVQDPRDIGRIPIERALDEFRRDDLLKLS